MGLTVQFKKNVKSDDREHRYPHDKVAGLFLRVTESGSKAFQLGYRYAKKDRSMVIGDPEFISLQDARDTARKHLVDIRDVIDPLHKYAKLRKRLCGQLSKELLERY